jgi:HAD superfamily hydrolase (TIGR01509 family)
MNLDHVGIEVCDLFTMELFYRKALGFTPRYRYVSANSPGLRTVFLQKDGVSLELLERPRPPSYLVDRPQPPNHLSLEVGDVDAAYAQVAAVAFPGVTLKPPRDTGDGFREAELRDPEGNVVELSTRVRPEPRYPVAAVVFDLDGTLVDSEPNYYQADKALLARYGHPFTEEDKRRYIGGSNLDMMIDVQRRYGLPGTPAELVEEKNAIYLEIAEANTPVYPEMKRFLDLVRGRELPVAVASGTSPKVLTRVLAAVGLSGAFDAVVSAEEVPRGKPAPDVFVEAARRLGVPAHACLAIEDSRPGVEAAGRAFMRTMAVPYLTDAPLPDAFLMADLLFPQGMSTFDAAKAMAWLAPLLS